MVIVCPTFCTVTIIPLPPSQEHFTNFYNLSGVIAVLLKQLPDRVTEVKQSGESRADNVSLTSGLHVYTYIGEGIG